MDDRDALINSLFRGFRQGGSLGYSDEAGAALQAGLGKLTGQGDYGKIYHDALTADRADDDSARAANPTAYGGAELVGGVVPLVAGGAALKAVAPVATPLSRVLGAATGGMAAGGGYSTADNSRDAMADSAQGGLEALATLAATHGAGKAVNGVTTAVQGKYNQYLRSKPLTPESVWSYLGDGAKERYLSQMREELRAPFNQEQDVENSARSLAYGNEFNRRLNNGEDFHKLLGLDEPPEVGVGGSGVTEELVPNPDAAAAAKPAVFDPYAKTSAGRKPRAGGGF